MKLLCGFGTAEIARALLKKEDAIGKAITRGKQKFKQQISSIELIDQQIKKRLPIVQKVIYLVFTEGYKLTKGNQLYNRDISVEAIRLGQFLVSHPLCNATSTKALMALMYYHLSRFKARINREGYLLTMEEKDRREWDKELITIGSQYLLAASDPVYYSTYYLQARIAAAHCLASSFEDTNWKEILACYDIQINHNRLPIIEMNRVVPLYKVYGVEVGLQELDRLSIHKKLLTNHLYYTIKASLMVVKNDITAARETLRKAIQFADNEVEKRHLTRKLSELT